MKQGSRRYISAIASIVILSSNIVAKDTTEVKIRQSDAWQLIGVSGIHSDTTTTTTTQTADKWGDVSTSSGEIKDVVDSDGNTTWYNFTADGTSGSAVETTDDNASLGIIIIKDKKLPDGTTANASDPDEVYIKGEFKVFDETSPKNSMYLKYGDNDPVIKITYQSDMEGTDIHIKFDNNNDEKFYTKIQLDSSYTYDNAFNLQGHLAPETVTITTTDSLPRASITEIYDENLSDNNRTGFVGDKFKISDDLTAKYDDTNITIYRYDNGVWKFYDSRNRATENDFTEFTTGVGYWVKVQKSGSDPSGFIFANGDITSSSWSTVYANLQAGWNLVSFNDEEILHTQTGIFIPHSDLDGSTTYTFKDAYGSDSFTLITAAQDSDSNASAYINFQVENKLQKGEGNFKIRAYPATRSSDDTAGIVVLCDRRFEISTTKSGDISTLGGDSLKPDQSTGYYFAPYGEYMLGIKPNSAIYNLDAPIKVTLQSIEVTRVEEDGATTITYTPYNKTISLSNKSNLSAVADSIDSALDDLKDTNKSTYEVDTDFDGTKDVILAVLDRRFGIKESSYYKLFQQTSSGGTVYVEGNVTGKSNASTITVSSSVSDTAADINNTYSSTGVKAFVTNSSKNTILLISDQVDLDIKEGSSGSYFKDLAINYSDGNDTKKGAITEIYPAYAFTDTDINYDNNDTYDYENRDIGKVSSSLSTLTSDLSYQTVWTKDFEIDSGIVQKLAKNSSMRVKKIYTAARTSKGLRWNSLDTTKPIEKWFNDYDAQTLFWTEKERGYWVYLEPFTATTITQTVVSVSDPVVTTHFDNNISSDGTSTTYNYVRKDISITTDGAGVLEYTYATVNGISYPFIDNGSSKVIRIDSYQMGITQGSSDKNIDLYSYDGLGNEASSSAVATVGIVKPSAPNLSWDTTTGDLIISNTDFASWDIHENNISDIDYSSSVKTSGITQGNYALYGLKLDPNWDSISLSKPYFDLKIVTKGSNGFYSDIKAIKYAPVLEESHVIEGTSGGTYGTTPTSHITSTNAPTIGADSGIGVKSLTSGAIRVAYHPITNDNEYVTLNNNLPNIMYVKTGSTNIAVLEFVSDYVGKKFYLYDEAAKKLYFGIFGSSYNNSNNAYTLTEITNYDLDGQPIIK